MLGRKSLDSFELDDDFVEADEIRLVALLQNLPLVG